MATPNTSPSTTRSKARPTASVEPPKKTFSVGPYRVHDIINRGESGPVFRASHKQLRHTVTLQVLRTPTNSDSSEKIWSVDRSTKFTKKIEDASRVIHDNVLRPIHHGRQNDVRYVAMEYVDGVNLRTILDREKSIDHNTACEIALQVATGLRHIHETGMVHGDVRPVNILLTRTGLVKISGLGISEFQFTNNTRSNDASYLAPEQLSNDTVDERADIFALGCTLYELITGEKAFESGNRATIPAALVDPQTTMSPVLVEALSAMIAFDRSQRLPTSTDVIHAMCTWANADRLPDLVARHINEADECPTQEESPQRPSPQPERPKRPQPNTNAQENDDAEETQETAEEERRATALVPTESSESAYGRRFALFVTRRELRKRNVIALSLIFAVIAAGVMAVIAMNQDATRKLEPTTQTPLALNNASAIIANDNRRMSPRSSTYHTRLNRSLMRDFGLPQGEWVLSPDESTHINSAIHYGHLVTASAVSGMEFTRTVALDVSKRGGAPWDAGYFIPDIEGVETGDRLLLVVWLRTQSASQNGELRIFCEREKTDEKDLYLTIKPDSLWRQYIIPFESKSDDVRRIGFHLAFAQQVVEYGGLAVLNYRQTVPFSQLPHELHGEFRDLN